MTSCIFICLMCLAPCKLSTQAAFAFSLVWSVGGGCDGDSREIFDRFLREILMGKADKHPIPAAVSKWECPFDEKGLVYDCSYEVCISVFNMSFRDSSKALLGKVHRPESCQFFF